ncbi:interleukin-17 receptor B isoform X2 [Manis pentadactyla]|uniref:interleukin-17 receptor B isoform X2 n=1 Tax=Manis pentadactyla TaxID=143292 RepID=UPI00255C4955|nr:interleukin-17 receptor B isoform X2 [Manis pentadactyla]
MMKSQLHYKFLNGADDSVWLRIRPVPRVDGPTHSDPRRLAGAPSGTCQKQSGNRGLFNSDERKLGTPGRCQHPLAEGHQDLRDKQKQGPVLPLHEVQLHRGLPDSNQTLWGQSFPVEPDTLYFIGAHNIPTAGMDGDSPSMSVNFTSPGCLDHVMRYKKRCIEAGSLWDPHITACKKNETTVEVNFTTSPLGNTYMALIKNKSVLGLSYVSEDRLTRTSVAIPVSGESEGAVVQLTPYFQTCGNDCIRRKGAVVLCPQAGVPFPPDNSRSVSGGWLPLLSVALLTATWVLTAGIYLMWRHERMKPSSPTASAPPVKVLVVYPSEICFHHTVCYFTEFLRDHCGSEVILEEWQKKKIAEMGPVQWLTTQNTAVDKVIFLLSNDVNTVCDETCGNSQDLFPLAFNLFCSDLRSQSHLHKYMVVHFRETDTKDDYNALRVCPKYRLMKDAAALCRELLRARQHAVGKRAVSLPQ